MTSTRHDLRPFAFLVLATGIYALYWSHRSLLTSLDNGGILSVALTLDLALLIPGLFFFMVLRPRGWPYASMLPIVTLGLITSHLLVPAQQRASLPLLTALPLVIEAALLTWIASRVMTAARDFRSGDDGTVDVLGASRSAVRSTLGNGRAGEVLAYELALFYYALVSWRQAPSVPTGDRFSCYRRCGYSSLLFGLGMVVACEEAMLHLVLHKLWSPTGAWVVSGFGIYGLLWFFGDWQALRRRPLELTQSAFELRVGLRWDLTIPYHKVTDLRRLTGYSHQPLAKNEGIDVSLSGTPTFEFTLAEPVTARGLYGLRREVTRVRFQVDDAERFECRWRQRTECQPGR